MKNWNEIEGNWTMLKGKVKEQWGSLTDQDIHRINGSRDQLVGALQERYGITLLEAQSQADHFVDDVDANRDQWINLSPDAKTALQGGGVTTAVLGAAAGSAVGPLGTVAGLVIGGVAGGALSAVAVNAIDKVDQDGSPDERRENEPNWEMDETGTREIVGSDGTRWATDKDGYRYQINSDGSRFVSM